MAYVTANRFNFNVVELDSVYFWYLWPWCLKLISVSVGTDPPYFSGQSCVLYSSRGLEAIRTSRPQNRLPTWVWECTFSVGIWKLNRTKRYP